jgi:Protein of unknown function (DUF1579)
VTPSYWTFDLALAVVRLHPNIASMKRTHRCIGISVTIATFITAALAQNSGTKDAASPKQSDVPGWISRGIPGAGHKALEPLIGRWRVSKSVYGTLGRSPDLPPIVSDQITTTREWVANGHYIQDTTEGTLDGNMYWRRGWLGYSNMDQRYEWVTIDPINTTMMYYVGKPRSGTTMPIDMTGVFTDQGVVNDQTVGKQVRQRTVIRIESNDQHTFELYFTPPGGKEQLADRSVYTRVK